jgi:hypothetical protein
VGSSRPNKEVVNAALGVAYLDGCAGVCVEMTNTHECSM